MGKSVTIGQFATRLCSNRPIRAPAPNWRQAEQYFKTYRDGKVKISLPKLKCLDTEPADAR